MDLIDRYLVAVRRQLPRHQQADIVQELADSLRSDAEDRERALGRPLTPEEQSAMLKTHGHPWLMASGYLPQQQLIGPALYPYYRQTLTFALFWVVLPVTLIGGAIAAIASGSAAAVWSRALGAAWNASIYAVGIVTIVFAVLERHQVRITALDAWNPMRLPEPRDGRRVSRFEPIVGLVFGLTMLIWWTNLVNVPDFIAVEGTPVRVVPAAIWSGLYWPILAVMAAGVAVSVLDLVRPWRTIAVSLLDIGVALASIAIVTMVVRQGQYVDVVGDARYAGQLAMADYWLNTTIGVALVVLGAVLIFDVLYELWKVYESRGAGLSVADISVHARPPDER